MFLQGKEFFDSLTFSQKIRKKKKLWTSRDSNPEPLACRASDLPLIYWPVDETKLKIDCNDSDLNLLRISLRINSIHKAEKKFWKKLKNPVDF